MKNIIVRRFLAYLLDLFLVACVMYFITFIPLRESPRNVVISPEFILQEKFFRCVSSSGVPMFSLNVTLLKLISILISPSFHMIDCSLLLVHNLLSIYLVE